MEDGEISEEEEEEEEGTINSINHHIQLPNHIQPTIFKGCSSLADNYEILEQVGQGTFGYFCNYIH